MTQTPFSTFGYQPAMPSGPSFKPKRKRVSLGAEEEENGAKVRLFLPSFLYILTLILF